MSAPCDPFAKTGFLSLSFSLPLSSRSAHRPESSGPCSFSGAGLEPPLYIYYAFSAPTYLIHRLRHVDTHTQFKICLYFWPVLSILVPYSVLRVENLRVLDCIVRLAFIEALGGKAGQRVDSVGATLRWTRCQGIHDPVSTRENVSETRLNASMWVEDANSYVFTAKMCRRIIRESIASPPTVDKYF